MSEKTPHRTESVTTPTLLPQAIQPETLSKSDQVRAKNFQQVIASAKRIRTLPGGERFFVRFNQLEILEHWILLINFSILAVTGLLEMFSNNRISADFITPVFRDLDNLRGLHNVAAIFYVTMAVIHAGHAVVGWFVKNEPPILMPGKQDWVDFIRTWKYLLSRSFPRPEFGRFTIDQKVTYWMVAGFSVLMLLTSLAQWFQTWVAQYLTEAILPISRSLHSLTGLLIVVTFLPWHIYHTVIKERNASIFSGVLNEKTIRHNHPIEYRQVIAAYDAYQAMLQTTSVVEPQAVVQDQEPTLGIESSVEKIATDEQPEITADQSNAVQS